MRRKIIAGNWKMNKTPSEATALCKELLPLVNNKDVDVVFCVPAIDIPAAVEATRGSNVAIGAEDVSFEDKGAFTGQISAAMLVDAGVKYAIVGHSERREYQHETSEDVNRKMQKCYEYGLTPIMCCGESLEIREAGTYMDWIKEQVTTGFAGISKENAAKTVVAYEPIWAIGTGKTASTEQAEEVCKAIRGILAALYDTDTAEAIRIQYGGSVNAGNAAELFGQPDIDGGLVGGASLKPDFGKVVCY